MITDQELNEADYGKSVTDCITELWVEINFRRSLQHANAFTRERILWLLMQK